MWRMIKAQPYSLDTLVKDCAEIQYQIKYKIPLETELNGNWIAWRIESSLVVLQLLESESLEKCIKVCNKDSKEE